MKLIVTIPALNEQRTIGRVVGDVPRQIAGVGVVEIIVLDDGSTDRTAELAAAAGARVVTLQGRRGLGHVFRTGMRLAIADGADFIVNIDGDGQFDSADVPRLIAPLLEGRADFVTCTRFGSRAGPAGMTGVKRWGNRTVTQTVNALAGLELSDVSCGFRAYNRAAAYRLTQFGRWTYTEECVLDLASKGMRIVEIPLVVRGQREHGNSRVAASVMKYGSHLSQIVLRVVRDIHPLYFFGAAAAICGMAGGLGVVGLMIDAIFFGGVLNAMPSAVVGVTVLLITAFLLLVVGLLADMTRRHRAASEELLYLARRRLHSGPERTRVAGSDASASRTVFSTSSTEISPMQ